MIHFALLLIPILSQAVAAQTALSAAREQVRHGNCEGAVETLKAVRDSDETLRDDSPLQLLAACYERLGQIDQANETLRHGLQSTSHSPALARTLGELLFRQNPNDGEAGQLLASAVKGNPRDPEARHYYAQWASLNNLQQICAEQEQAAVRLLGLNDPALLQMYTVMGLCLDHVEQAGSAKKAFEKAYKIDLRLRTFDPAMAYQYIQFLISRGESQPAKIVVAETLRRSPHFGPAHLEQAKFLDHERQTEKAIDEAKAALTGEGDDDGNIRAAHALLARNYFILGKAKEAEEEQRWVESNANTTKP